MSLRIDTKRAIVNAFLELIEIKRFEDISVLDIMDRCGGNRQTFYRHFHDKYELVNWIYAEEIKTKKWMPMAKISAGSNASSACIR